jgi:hypothetical protein
MSSLNINFQTVTIRNYTPERTFVTKWDVEIENTRVKKISRGRERDTKYFDDFDRHANSLPVKNAQAWDIDSHHTDGEGEETRQAWLRAVEAENAYYERKYSELNDNFDWYDMNQPQTTPCKRNLDFDEHAIFKRIRA